jgi:hypothetical protein
MKGLLITAGVIIVLVASTIVWAIGTSNTEIRLRNRMSGQQEMCQAYYTKLWEILKTKAGVAEEYADQFKDIQTAIMEGRYSGDKGEMMLWIQEANPQFDASLYKDVMNAIEGERNGFFVEQQKLRDMKVQHDNMLKIFPSKLVLANREPIDVVILKNVATQVAYETGTDQSPELFSKSK